MLHHSRCSAGLWSRCSLGLRAVASITTCSGSTCPTRRPCLTSTSSITTPNRFSPWPKSCTRGTTGPTRLTTSSGCFTRSVSSSGCTRRTSTAWRDVRIYMFCFLCLVEVALSSRRSVSAWSGRDSSGEAGGGPRYVLHDHLHVVSEEIRRRDATSEFRCYQTFLWRFKVSWISISPLPLKAGGSWQKTNW